MRPARARRRLGATGILLLTLTLLGGPVPFPGVSGQTPPEGAVRPGGGGPGSPEDSNQERSPAEDEVWNTVMDLWRLSSELDLEGWFQRVSDDYRGWSVAEETPRGKAAWLAQARERFSAPRRVHHRLVPRAVDVHGDVAIAYYHYAAITRSEEGALSTSRGQWTDVFRREGSEWKLLADAGGETHSLPEAIVSTEWLARRLGDPEIVILQVESREERFTDGHIPGAVFIPYQAIAWDGPNQEGAEFLPPGEIQATLEGLGVDDHHHLVVYGSHPLVSARLWLTLDVLGVGARVSFLDGGLPAWTEEGRPLSTDPAPARPPSALNPGFDPNVIVDADWILTNLDDPSMALVDARYVEEYTGEGQETEAVGHLPGAGNAPWEDLLESTEVFRLRALPDLAAALEGAGAGPGETVVPYCIVGLRASLDYLVARLLGFETRFYDGSWRDWTNRDLPLVQGRSPR